MFCEVSKGLNYTYFEIYIIPVSMYMKTVNPSLSESIIFWRLTFKCPLDDQPNGLKQNVVHFDSYRSLRILCQTFVFVFNRKLYIIYSQIEYKYILLVCDVLLSSPMLLYLKKI